MPGSTSAPKQASDVLAGEAFGKYVLVKRIAMGGMAEVCLARLQGTAGFNKLVVIKQVLPAFAESPQFVEMFLDEGRLAAKLSHPNIAQTFELGEEQGRHYIAMEFVPGESLYGVLKRCREKGLMLPMGCMLRITMQLLEALEYAHSLCDESGLPLQLVHRDITPSNVMVTHHGAIKLLDFGIARAATQVHRTEAGRVKGKGGYMAPEQCRSSKVDHRADVYGAGAVLYLMATGMKPFEHLPVGTDLMSQMNATMEGSYLKPSQVKKDINPELEQLILKAMALKPEDRFQSAGDMLEELEHFAAKVGVFPSPRELGDFVKKLFPPKGEEPADPAREPSSSRATPHPKTDDRLATVDPGSDEVSGPVSGRRKPGDVRAAAAVPTDPMSQTVMEPEEGTQPSMPAVAPLKPAGIDPKLLLVAGAGVVLVTLGVALALTFFRKPGTDDGPPPPERITQPEPALAPVAAPAPQAAPAPVAKDAEPVDAAPPAAAPDDAEETAAADEKPAKVEGGAPAHPPRSAKKKRDAAPAPPPAPKALASGALQVNAYPWAKVREKGKELGVTPFKVTLSAGAHVLEFENPALNVKKQVTVLVKEGQETVHFEKLQ